MKSAKVKVQKTFKPIPLLESAFWQTILSTYSSYDKGLDPDFSHLVRLPDGDALYLLENRPVGWYAGDRVVVVVHGLTGSCDSPYMVRLADKLLQHNYMVIRVNLRTCGPGFGFAKQIYHCGRSEDTRAILQWLAKYCPTSPVTQIGFSLGANITLKMIGEDGLFPTGNIDSIIAISPPADLKVTSERMATRENLFFDQYFVGHLRKDVRRLHAEFPELGPVRFPKKMTTAIFDEIYTAPMSGFKDAMDYYIQSSSSAVLKDISVPTLIVAAEDDPVVDVRVFVETPHNENVILDLQKHGGHMGFLGWGLGRWNLRTLRHLLTSPRWMDVRILDWLTCLPRRKQEKPIDLQLLRNLG